MNAPYFAYGANLDVDAMQARCPGAAVIGKAVLEHHRLVAMREGWLSITPSPGDEVDGLLWQLAAEHMPALDHYEDVAAGLYVHATMTVRTEDGDTLEALVYVGNNAGPGVLHAEYAQRVARAARSAAGRTTAETILRLAGPG